jgi:cyanophycinase-like exopeptidase
MYRHTEIMTYRHTQTNRQTDSQSDSAKVLIQAEKRTDVQKDQYMVHTNSTVHKTDIQQTDSQTVYECCVKNQVKISNIKKVCDTYPCKY